MRFQVTNLILQTEFLQILRLKFSPIFFVLFYRILWATVLIHSLIHDILSKILARNSFAYLKPLNRFIEFRFIDNNRSSFLFLLVFIGNNFFVYFTLTRFLSKSVFTESVTIKRYIVSGIFCLKVSSDSFFGACI